VVRIARLVCSSAVIALTTAACGNDGSEIYANVAPVVGQGGSTGETVTSSSTGTGSSTGPSTSDTTSSTTGSMAASGTSTSGTTDGAGGASTAATSSSASGGAGGSSSTTTGAGGSMQPDAAVGGPDSGPKPDAGTDLIGTPFKMLVFTLARAFVHDSIPTCVQMLTDFSVPNKFTMTVTQDPAAFTDDNLKQYDLIFFVSTTGGIFSDAMPAQVGVTAKAAFQKYMENGGGYAGVHAATDCERDGRWPWYQDFMGALWSGTHDNDGTPGTVILQNVDHPAIRGLPTTWIRPNGEEWYKQTRSLDGLAGVTILAKLAADQRPVSWIHELPGGGRMFYTIQGHNIKYYAEDTLRKHILGGLLWAAHRAK
jgi:type 1 glutamine amidotransferase